MPDDAGLTPEIALDSSILRMLARQMEEILGDRFQKLSIAEAKASASATPPEMPQHVMELIAFANATANALDAAEQLAAPMQLDARMLADLMSLMALLNRWNRHPAMPNLLDTLSHQTEPQHTLMVLCVASALVDAGNGVGVYFREASGKVADLWVDVSLEERIELEVKVPLSLRRPTSPLSPEAATRVVEKALKKAHGQLQTGSSHMLAIGGFHIGHSVEALEVAARRLLHRQRGRRQQFMGIVILNMAFSVEPGLGLHVARGINPEMETLLVTHRGYSGGLKIQRADA